MAREASFLLAKTCLREKGPLSLKKAGRVLEKLAEGEFNDNWKIRAKIELLKHLNRTGQAEDAVRELDRLLAQNRHTYADILFAEALGDIHCDHQAWTQALRAYQHAFNIVKELYYSDSEGESDLRNRIGRKLRDVRRRVELGEPGTTFKLARDAQKAGKYERAIFLYKKIRAEYSEDRLAHASGYRIGECLLKRGKLDEAEKQWKGFVKAGEIAPWRCDALIGLGDLTLEYRLELKKAERIYRQADSRFENGELDETWKLREPDVAIRLGVCAYLRGKYKEAEAFFDKADKLRPDTRWGTGVSGGMGLLVEACRKRQPLLPKRLKKEKNRRAHLVLLLGAIYAKSWQDKRANELFRRVAKGEFKATKLQRAYARMKEGDAWRQQWKDDEALRCFKDFEPGGAYDKTPWAAESIIRAAVIQYQKEDMREEAVQKFHLVLERYPKNKQASRAQLYLGQHWFWEGDYKRAIKEWKKLVKKYPKSMWAKQARTELIPRAKQKLKER